MAQITISSYPSQVHHQTRMIPIQVSLAAGLALATDVELDMSNTTPGVALIVANPITGALLTWGSYCFLQLTALPFEDYVVPATRPLDAKVQIAVKLRVKAANGGGDAEIVYIGISPTPITVVSTDRKQTASDDFSDLNYDRWQAQCADAGADVVPHVDVNLSRLRIYNDAGVESRYQTVRSELIEGRAHVEFRQVAQSVHQDDSGFAIILRFLDQNPLAGAGAAGVLSGAGDIFVGFNLDDVTAAPLNEANATRVHFNCSAEYVGGAAVWGADETVVLAESGVTTDLHDYTISFDGHVVRLYIDGVLAATRSTRIPRVSAKWFYVEFTSVTNGPAPAVPAADEFLAIDRVDARPDEHLATMLVSKSGRDVADDMNGDLDGMSTCLPGHGGEQGSHTTLAAAAAADTIYTVPAGVSNGYYWVKVPKDAAGNEQLVRISAPAAAVATSIQQSSDEQRVTLGPLNAGDIISYYRDVVAGIVIQYARIS